MADPRPAVKAARLVRGEDARDDPGQHEDPGQHGVAASNLLVYKAFFMAGQPDKDQEFFPRGAIAFFAAMTAFFLAVWLALYALMINRH